jgi:hypothetical protein
LSPVVLVNGRAKGVWSCTKKRKRLNITIQLFERISENARKKVEEEAADLARFNDMAYELSFSKAFSN